MGRFFYSSYFSDCIVYEDGHKFRTSEQKVHLRLGMKEHAPHLTVMQDEKSSKISVVQEHIKGKWISGELCLTEPKEFITNDTSTSCNNDTNMLISEVEIKNALVCQGCSQGTVTCGHCL